MKAQHHRCGALSNTPPLSLNSRNRAHHSVPTHTPNHFLCRQRHQQLQQNQQQQQCRFSVVPHSTAAGELSGDENPTTSPSEPSSSVLAILQPRESWHHLVYGTASWLAAWKPPRYVWRTVAAFVLGGEAIVRILQGK